MTKQSIFLGAGRDDSRVVLPLLSDSRSHLLSFPGCWLISSTRYFFANSINPFMGRFGFTGLSAAPAAAAVAAGEGGGGATGRPGGGGGGTTRAAGEPGGV